jgi:2-polyprenyl-3-methyl-5-hydroxy-6-metoxy-1,4-benzoquinol methylase
MSHPERIDSTVLSAMPDDLANMRILDMGFGYGSWGFMLRTRKTGNPYIVGVEPHKPYTEAQRRVKIYDEVHNMTAQEYFEGHHNEKFNVELFCEVAEHIEKKDAIATIRNLKKHLDKGGLLIVSTPDGTSPGAPMLDGNKRMVHLCGFRAKDLEREGFNVKHISTTRYGKVADFLTTVWFLLKLHRRPVIRGLLAFYWEEGVKS